MNRDTWTLIKLVFISIIMILIILLISYTYSFDFNNEKKIHIVDNRYEIKESAETDADIIENVFMEGMNPSEYIKVLDQKSNYIRSNGEYINIDYNFEHILHYSEIEEILYRLNNSDIVSLEIIGKSEDNRNIYGIEIGKGDRVLFLDANIHAAEVANTAILTRFMIELVNMYEIGDNETIEALNNVKIAIIPCINPDGYEVFNFGIESINNKDLWIYQNRDKINFENLKSNANGVDLNRNFPTQNAGLYYKGNKLIKSVSLTKSFDDKKYFNGYSLGSESEIKAAMYFMLKHYKNTYAYVNMHTQGRVIYAGKPNLSHEFNNLCINFGEKVSNITKYKLHGLSAEEVGEGNDGSATDFMAEIANGFIFSTKSGRLSTDKYINDSIVLKYRYPVITLETTKKWTTNPQIFKEEYYNNGIRKLLFELIK